MIEAKEAIGFVRSVLVAAFMFAIGVVLGSVVGLLIEKGLN